MKPRTPFIFRVYTVAGEPDRQVVLAIGRPRPALGDWACRVRILGIPNGREDVSGIDPLQAMQFAILRARRMLDASGLPLLWQTDGVPGDVGIPLPVPTGNGFEFQRRLEGYIERKDKEFNEAVATFLKEKERLQEAKRRVARARDVK